MDNEQLYRQCRESVAAVESLQDIAAVHDLLGQPIQTLPIGNFFRTNPDLTITYCDLVELHHFRNCAIRIGYIGQQIVKVRGMPLEHWKPPQ